MKLKPVALALVGGLALSACAIKPSVVTRGVEPGLTLLTQDGAEPARAAQAAPGFSIVDMRVIVPETLKVSEANTYKPRADIVWRGDPFGNRYEQVAAIMREAAERGVRDLDGERDGILVIEVAKFHALTEKARYTVGGTHDSDFWMSVVDAETGDVIVPRRFVDTALPALGGRAALAAEARGDTQKVRIEAFISEVVAEELTMPVANAPA